VRLQIRIADIPHRFSEGVEDATPARPPARRAMHVLLDMLAALRARIAGTVASAFAIAKLQPLGVLAKSRRET